MDKGRSRWEIHISSSQSYFRLTKSNFYLNYKAIPCFLLLWFTLALMRRLRENNAKRAQLLKDQNKKSLNYDRTTFTLIVVLGVFLLTELPQGVLTILNGIFTNDVHTVFYMNLANLLDLLSLINCYVGFLAYCFLCTKYQQTFVLMIFTWSELFICYYRSESRKSGIPIFKVGVSISRTGNSVLFCRQDPSYSIGTLFKCFGVKRNTVVINQERRKRASRKQSAHKRSLVRSSYNYSKTDCEMPQSHDLTTIFEVEQGQTQIYIDEKSSGSNIGSSDFSISSYSSSSECDQIVLPLSRKQHILVQNPIEKFDSKLDIYL
uniref:G-protein coupled receptors family 1 profile domain-containing protein n=1 Tax=Meloidogyne enterolobii TaxID=390850 RepID=A0A6V7XT98_MELEN|nr:unnamed protein product [Meloidogyne enterolobii]CAD2202580.1 unnamed protein product [Meloidogyne enterolobii]